MKKLRCKGHIPVPCDASVYILLGAVPASVDRRGPKLTLKLKPLITSCYYSWFTTIETYVILIFCVTSRPRTIQSIRLVAIASQMIRTLSLLSFRICAYLYDTYLVNNFQYAEIGLKQSHLIMNTDFIKMFSPMGYWSSHPINIIHNSSFILVSLHIFKCSSYQEHIHKLSTFYHGVNLHTKSLTLAPTSFLKETW